MNIIVLRAMIFLCFRRTDTTNILGYNKKVNLSRTQNMVTTNIFDAGTDYF